MDIPEVLQWIWADENSAKLRNMGLLLLGAIGLPLAIWRSILAQRQFALANRGQDIDRFESAAKMLVAEEVETVIAGIHTLGELVDHPGRDYDQTIRLMLERYVRNNTKRSSSSDISPPPATPEEIVLAFKIFMMIRPAIKSSSKYRVRLESKKVNFFRFGNVDLVIKGVYYKNVKFFSSEFYECNFRGIFFDKCKFIDCEFIKSNFANARFFWAEFVKVDFYGANLEGADFSNSTFKVVNFADAVLVNALFPARLNVDDCFNLTVEQYKTVKKPDPDFVRALEQRPSIRDPFARDL